MQCIMVLHIEAVHKIILPEKNVPATLLLYICTQLDVETWNPQHADAPQVSGSKLFFWWGLVRENVMDRFSSVQQNH